MPQNAIIKQKTKSESAQAYYSNIVSGTNNLWFYFGNPVSWATYPGGEYNETNPPLVKDNLQNERDIWNGIIGLKNIDQTDTRLAIKRVNWASGQYYDMYRDDYDGSTVTGVSLIGEYVNTKPLNLALSNNVVLSEDNNVYRMYRCIDNRSASTGLPVASTIKPVFTVSSVQTLADGYKWKFLATLTTAEVNEFLTSSHAPIPTAAITATAAGLPLSVVMTNRGAGYTTIPTVTIKGDSTGLVLGTPVIVGGGIAYIPITTTGVGGYSNIQLTISGGGSPTVTATAKVILSPLNGGFGSDITTELEPNYLITRVNNNSTDYYYPTRGNAPESYATDGILDLRYRSVGLIENPTIPGYNPATTNLARNVTEYRYNESAGTLVYGDRLYTAASGSANAVATVVSLREDTSVVAISLTFNAATTVTPLDRTITIVEHNLLTGDSVLYNNGEGTSIGGLTNNSTYYVIRVTADTFKLASSAALAQAGTAIAITAGVGTSHTITDNVVKRYVGLLQTTEQKIVPNPLVAGAYLTRMDNTAAIYLGPYTEFNGGSGSIVNINNNTISIPNHPWATGDQVTYSRGAGTVIGGLTNNATYRVIRISSGDIKLAQTLANANLGIAVDLTALGNGTHNLVYTGTDTVSAASSVKYTGSIIFSEYRNPVTRTTSKEKFRFVLEF
jgi:hypothetical protein